MPIPVINFAALQPQGNPALRDLLPTILQGLQLGYAPSMLQEELKAKQLKNALAQIENQFAPRSKEAEIGYKEAQIPYLNEQTRYYGPNIQSEMGLRNAQMEALQRKMTEEQENPLIGQSGVAGQIGALLYLQQHPELGGQMGGLERGGALGQIPSDTGTQSMIPNMANAPPPNTKLPQQNQLADLLYQSILAEKERKESFSEYFGQKSQGYKFNSLPPDERKREIAQAVSIGYDPLEALDAYMNGATPKDLAELKGIPADKMPAPRYAPTGTTVTRLQQRNQLMAELNYLEPIIAEAVAPYARRFSGYSPKQIVESLKGVNPEARQRYLAAMAIYPDLISVRARGLGAQTGIELMRHMTEASLGRIKVFESQVSPEDFEGMSRYIKEYLGGAMEVANQEVNPSASAIEEQANRLTLSPKEQKALQNQGIGTPGGMVKFRDPNGKIVLFPAAQADQVLAKYPRLRRVE